MTGFHTRNANRQISYGFGRCSLGSILVASSERGICAISLGDDPERMTHQLLEKYPYAKPADSESEFEQLIARIAGFVEAPVVELDLPLDMCGTAFQQRVWQTLREIPVGTTVSYADIARQIDAAKAVRAVAGACAANTLAVAIPCHRVVRSDGSLSGYRWGVERKAELQRREKQQALMK